MMGIQGGGVCSRSAAGLLLGVDGGGTRTDCLVTTAEGVVIGRGSAGPSNIQAMGIGPALEEIRKAVYEAMREAVSSAGAPCRSVRVASACFGLAGVGRESDRDLMKTRLGYVLAEVTPLNAPPVSLIVASDGVIALAGANAGEPGVVVIAGTGSLAYGMSPDGREARAGGWGYILGDEGSAYHIGLKGLREALRAADGRRMHTSLVEDLPAALGVKSIEEIIPIVYSSMARAEIAALAPVVGQAATDGDEVASNVILGAGRELGLMAAAVIRRLGMDEYAGCVSAVGGVLESNEMVLWAMRDRVEELVPGWSVARGKYPPVAGAILIAARTANGASIDKVIHNIGSGLQEVPS